MLTARISTDSSSTSTVIEGPASIMLMESKPGAVLADRWVEIAIDDEGGVQVFVGEGDDDISEVYDSRRVMA